MSTIRKVAVVGAGATVGAIFVQALLDADFEVTVLTRQGGSKSEFPASVKVVTVDYNDVSALTEALTGQDALLSNVGMAGLSLQSNFIDAVLAAKVKRFIPSEFGCDLENPNSRGLPVFASKVTTAEEVEKKMKGTDSTYTYIYNNAFLDWGIERKLIIDLENKKIDLVDGGDHPFTSTPVPFVGKAIAAVLKNPEATANRGIRVHGAKLTPKLLLSIAKRVVGSDGWTVTESSSAEIEKQSYENMKKDPANIYGWVIGFLVRAIYAEDFGGDFSKNNDNELLGLKELEEKEIEEIVRQYA